MNEVHAARSRTTAARSFAEKWAGRGYEEGGTGSFWLQLLRDFVGMNDVTTNVRFEQSTATHRYIDVNIPDAKTDIEQKSPGIYLDKPDVRYAESTIAQMYDDDRKSLFPDLVEAHRSLNAVVK